MLFPRKMTPEEGVQKFHTDDVSVSKLGGACTCVWVVTRHHYGISALVSQTSFPGETSGGVAKCRLFSQAVRLSRIHLATVFDAILTSRQTREKLQCLYGNLMSNNYRKTAVLEKI